MTLAHDRGDTSAALLDETIGANLERIVAAHGDDEALVETATGRRWTYRELDRDVDRVARGLLAAGIVKGDRVGIWAPNCAEWTLVQFATAKIGAVLVTVNPAYRTHELAYALDKSGVRMLIAATEVKGTSFVAMVDEVLADSPVEHVVYLGTDDWTGLLDLATGDEDVAGIMASLSPDEPINIQYTSGTTGQPKGATLSHRNILNNAHDVAATLKFTSADRLCIPVPFYHCFGMVIGNLGCVTHGATMVIPAPLFDPAATLRALHEERCTAVYGVPTMYVAMLGLESFAEHDLSSMRTGLISGAPVPVELMKRCRTLMHMDEISTIYGMTETSPASTGTHVDDSIERRTETVGRALPNVEIRIADPVTGVTLQRGETGEFCTRGYSVMLGYWNDEAKTAEAIDADGWMHTGDLAVMREDGYCAIVGRIKDMVIRGGENVYPREIEEFLHTHPDIADAHVVGVPDATYGEELCAWIRMRPGTEPLDAKAVRAFATGRLAHFKIPRYVTVVEGFPMTVTGKVRKVEMRAASIEALGLSS